MKIVKLSLAAVMTAGLCTVANANSLAQAIQDGKLSGEVSITYESRDQDKEVSKGYSDTAYAVSSIGLNYKTAQYNNFSVNVGFRAFTNIYEDDKNFITNHGTGDATERIYDEKGYSILADTYLAYDINNFHVKIGRQQLSTEWLNRMNDAITINANPLKNAELELIYTQRRGRSDNRNLRHMTDVNKDKGLYKAGFTYKFNDNIKTKLYYMDAPQAYSLIGGKINLDGKFDTVKTGLLIHAMETSEDDINKKDGEMIEIKAYTTINGYTATLAYVETGKENGWGSAANYGDTVVPFEEGDQMYKADASTVYGMISKNFDPINLTILYGITEYGNYEKDELNIWAGYKFNKETSLKIGYAVMNEDEKDSSSTDMNQLNATLAYKF